MMQLYKEFEESILQQAVAKFEERKQLVSLIPWGSKAVDVPTTDHQQGSVLLNNTA